MERRLALNGASQTRGPREEATRKGKGAYLLGDLGDRDFLERSSSSRDERSLFGSGRLAMDQHGGGCGGERTKPQVKKWRPAETS